MFYLPPLLVLSATIAIGYGGVALAGNVDQIPATPMATVVAPNAGTDWSGLNAGGLVSFNSGDIETFSDDVFVSSFTLNTITAFGGFVGYSWADITVGAPVYPSSGLHYGVGVDVMLNTHMFLGAE